MKIRGVVFDMDGLMFDTENLTYKLQHELLRKKGVEYPFELYKTTVGKRSEDIEEFFCKLCGEGFVYADFRVESRTAYENYTDKFGVPIKDGLFELLVFLKEKGIKTAVATSTTRPSAQRTLRISGALPYFDELVCADDVTRGKPHPDPFLKAAEKLGLEPEECLALEDSLNGIKSAHAAKMTAVMVPDIVEPTDEIRPLCFRILPSLNEVSALIENSFK